MDKLTEKQKRFADYYIETGNATESYKKAYESCTKDETARANASRLLTKANILEYISERNKQLDSYRIANMQEVKEFWTNFLRSENIEPKDRLKASEFIAKTNGAFLDRVEQTNIEIVIDIEEDDVDD